MKRYATLCTILLLAAPALATKWEPPEPPPPEPQPTSAAAEATAGSDASAAATSAANSDAGSTSSSQAATAPIATTTTTTNRTQFYGLALQFPQGFGDCFGGVQGGAQGDDGGGFLGWHALNDDCVLGKLADAEQDVSIRARYRCGQRIAREALTFDMTGSRRSKQARCVSMLEASGRAMIGRIQQQLEEARLAQEQCMAGRDRVEEAWRECEGK